MHLCWSSSNVPHLPSILGMLQGPHVSLIFGRVHNPWRLPCETTSKRLRDRRFSTLWLLASKCASRHNGVHFFQKCSENGVFCAFWLRNVVRTATASTFQQLNFQKWSEAIIFQLLTSKCASRRDGVQFFSISTPKSALGEGCFWLFDFEICFAPQRRAIFDVSSGGFAPAALASLLLDPPEPQNIFSSLSRIFYLFARLLFLLTLFLLWSSFFFSSRTLPHMLFHPSILTIC